MKLEVQNEITILEVLAPLNSLNINEIASLEIKDGDQNFIQISTINNDLNIQENKTILQVENPVIEIIDFNFQPVSLRWGNITGDLINQLDLIDEFNDIKETYEYISRNLASSNYSINRNGDDVVSIVYDNGITKTLNRSGENITSITLSGDNITTMTKTIIRTDDLITGIEYS